VETRGDPLSAPRLSDATLGALKPGVARPAYDRGRLDIGVVHFGPGAFHRAHQGAYFDALAQSDPRWGISDVALRTPGVRDALVPQDGLFGLALLDEPTEWRVIGVVRELLVAAERPQKVFARLADPKTRLVTVTVTEKGYALAADGSLDLDHPDIRRDLAGGGAPRSAVGWIVEGLRRRRAVGLKPFVVASCDNLADNGRKLGAAVCAFAAEIDADLARWIAAEGRFPNSMVDAITPATDDDLRVRAAQALGLADAWPIQRERFSQWVMEDVFGPDGPDLARVGVTLSNDVAGFAEAKLRLLNGAHSTLAYLGLLRGQATVREAMDDAELADFVGVLMRDDIAATLRAPKGLDLDNYIGALLDRFRNGAVRHLLSQIAWDGSQKLPVRLLSTVRDAIAQGRPLERLAIPVAAWMRFVRAASKSGAAILDPMADTLARIGSAATGDASDVADYLALEPVFADLGSNPIFADAVTAAYRAIGDRGVLADA
jgi:fructuronate reductase